MISTPTAVIGAVLALALQSSVWALGEAGSTAGGAFVSDTQFTEKLSFSDVPSIIQRTRIRIPADYGTLINMYAVRQGHVLWFQNDEGVIRNVIIGEKDLVYIQRQGSVGP